MAANTEVTRADCENLLQLYDKVEKENDVNTPDIWELESGLARNSNNR